MKMKKVFSVFLLVVFLAHELFFPIHAFATDTIIFTTFQLNGVASSVSINPGDIFKLRASGNNALSYPLKELFVKIKFQDVNNTYINNYFNYTGNHRTRIA